MNNKALYKIEAFQIGQTKNGKEMWRLSLTSIEDNKPLTGVIWSEEISRFDGAKFRVGNVIRFLGQDYNSNYNSVVIKNVTVVKEALLGLPKEFANSYLKEIKDFLISIEEKYPRSQKLAMPAGTYIHTPSPVGCPGIATDSRGPKYTPAVGVAWVKS